MIRDDLKRAICLLAEEFCGFLYNRYCEIGRQEADRVVQEIRSSIHGEKKKGVSAIGQKEHTDKRNRDGFEMVIVDYDSSDEELYDEGGEDLWQQM